MVREGERRGTQGEGALAGKAFKSEAEQMVERGEAEDVRHARRVIHELHRAQELTHLLDDTCVDQEWESMREQLGLMSSTITLMAFGDEGRGGGQRTWWTTGRGWRAV